MLLPIKYGLFFFIFCCSYNLIAQSATNDWTNEGLIWRGFNFTWEKTNHRLSRLVIKPELLNQSNGDCTFTKGRCDPSKGYKFVIWDSPKFGTDAKSIEDHIVPPDVFRLHSNATYMHSKGNYSFYNTIASFDNVEGEHGQLYDKTLTVEVPLPTANSFSNYEAFINGIMISSVGDADKLEQYSCEVVSSTVVNSTIIIKVRLSVSFGCKGPGKDYNRDSCLPHFSNMVITKKRIDKFECTDNSYQYIIKVPLLLVASNYEMTTIKANDQSSWETAGGKCFGKVATIDPSEMKAITREFIEQKININHVEEGIGKRVIGIKKMNISLSEESHIFRWESLFFVEGAELKSLLLFDPSPYRKDKVKTTVQNLSFTSKGNATMGMTLGIVNGVVDGAVTPITTKRSRSCSRVCCKPYCACDTESNAKPTYWLSPQ